MSECEYCQIKGGYGELIEETPHWMIFLAPSQRYLGTCVVALKRKTHDLSDVEDTEWVNFIDILRRLENSVKLAFKPNLFNWSCFKNMAFRDEDPDPEIHWHFLPRYRYEVEFEGVTFEDPDFGYIPKPVERRVSREMMMKIKSAIKENL